MKIMSIFTRQLSRIGSFAINRYFHSSHIYASYEGDGKTTITVLNKNFDYGLMINNVSEQGFILNNGVRTVGPIVLFSKLMLSWNIASSPDMNKESLSLLLNLEPKLDILLIGLDKEYPPNAPFILNIKDLCHAYKIPVEILPVYHACSTFNFLNSENRYIAAALVPPKLDDDLLGQNQVKLEMNTLSTEVRAKNKKTKKVKKQQDEHSNDTQ